MCRLRGKRDSCKSVHDQVYEEELENVEGALSERQSGQDHCAQAGHIDSDLELEELPDVEIEVAALHDEGHNVAEGVVLEDDMTGVLCNLTALLAH